MAIVGTASVEIHAILTAVAGEIRAGVAEGMQGVGTEAGATFGREFGAAATGSLDASLAGIRAEIASAYAGATSGVSELTQANIRAAAAQQELNAATQVAVAAEREYMAAIQQATASMAEAVAAEDAVSGAARAEAAARTAAAEAALAGARANSEASAQTVAALEADVAAARGQQAAMEEAATAQIMASQEEAAAKVKAAADSRAAALEEVQASQMAADSAKSAAAVQVEMANTQAAASASLAAKETADAEVRSAAATKGMKSWQMMSTAVVVAAGAAVVEGVKMATDFQAATERLVTSAGENQKALDGVRTGILDMAGQVGYTSQQLATAMYTIESGGQHGAAGLAVLKASAQGAKTENADLKTVADAVTSALTDYGTKAGTAADVTSKLVAATGQGKMTFQDLSGAMSAILPIASANHVSLNDILGDLASMTLHGISAQQASENLADALKHMAAPTQVQTKELATLGINAQQLSTDLGSKGLSGTIGEISTAIQNQMGPGATKVIVNLQNALAGLPPSVQKLGNELINGTISAKDYMTQAKALDPISKSQATSFMSLADSFYQVGTKQVTGKVAMQSYTDALRKAMGDATGLNVALMTTGNNSGTTAKAIAAVSKAGQDAGGNVKGWAEIQSTFNVTWSKFVDGLGAGAIKMGTSLLPALTKIVQVLSDAFNFIASHQAIAQVFATILGVVVAGAVVILADAIGTKLVGGLGKLKIAMAENPFTMWLTIIIMVATAIIENWGPISHFFEKLWSDVSGFFMGVWNPIWSFMKGVGAWFAGPFVGFFQDIWSFLVKWGPMILAVFMPIIGIPLLIIQHWQDIVTFFQNLPGMVGGFFVDLGNKIMEGATAAWHWLVNAAETAGTNLLAWLAHLPQDIAYGLGFLAGLIVKLSIEAFLGLVHGAETAWTSTMAWFAALPGRVMAGLASLGSTIGQIATDAWHNFTTNISTAWNDTMAWLQALPGRFMAGLASLGTSLATFAVKAWDGFTNGLSTAWSATLAYVESLPQRFITGLGIWRDRIVTFAEDAWGGFTDGLSTAWNATMSWLAALPGRFMSAVAGAGTWLLSAGGDIIHGLLNGIQAAWNGFWSWVGSLWSSFIQGFKDALGISSPSTVFLQFGQWIIEGLWNGIQAIWNTMVSWFGTAVTAFINFFKGLWNDLQAFWNLFWSAIQNIASAVWTAIKTFLTNEMQGWANLFSAIWNGIKDAFNTVWTWLQNIATTVWNAIKTFLTNEMNGWANLFSAIWNGIKDVFNTVWTWLQNIATTIWNAIKTFLTNEMNGWANLFSAIWNGIKDAFNAVWTFIQNIATTVWNWLKAFWTSELNAFSQFFSSIWNAIQNAFQAVWNFIQSIATTVWNAISAFFTGAFNGFVGFFQGIWNGVSTFFSAIWNGIKGAASSIWGGISSFFTGALNGFVGWFQGIWNNVSGIFTGVWNGIRNLASSIWGDISGFFVSGINKVIGFLNGMIHGINKVLGWVSLGPIGDIPGLAAGGVLTYTVQTNIGNVGPIKAMAQGGMLDFSPVGAGFKTTGPKAIVGEGNPQYPEYVIPTDPGYRGRARNLLAGAAKDMGLMDGDGSVMLATGGVLHPTGPGGLPMLGLGDMLGAAWDATGGKVVSGIASAADAVGSAVMAGINDVEGLLAKGVNKVIDGIAGGAEALIPKNLLIGQEAIGVIEKMKSSLESWISGGAAKKQAANAAANYGPAAGAPGGGVEQWRGLVTQVLGELGLPTTAVNGVLSLIQHESGGNPNAINLTDSNAKAGHPSQGLMQTIPTTFRAYAGPYANMPITDPHANIYAGINYANKNYGIGMLIAGGRHNAAGAYIGYESGGVLGLEPRLYDSGGLLAPGMTMAMNNTGQHELIMPYDLLKDAIKEGFEYRDGKRTYDRDDDWARDITTALNIGSHANPTSLFMPNYFKSADPRVTGGLLDRTVGPQSGPVATSVTPQQPSTSTAVRPTVPTGDIGSAFSQALTQFAPELSQAISAGSANQIVTLGQALLSNPDRMKAINQSVADQLGASVEDVSGQLQDVISSSLPTAVKQQGADDMSFGAAGTPATATMTSAQSTISAAPKSGAGDVTFHPGALAVNIHGNADSVTVQQLQGVLNDWSDELVHQIRGRR